MTRLHSPAADRNRDPILQVLRDELPSHGLVLEIASGSGQHVVHFARAFPSLAFQPTDPDPKARVSIDAWAADEALQNVRPALDLDASRPMAWPVKQADAILCINMIHISPWEALVGLLRGAGTILTAGGLLYVYGPYRRGGAHTAPSNAEFDARLRRENNAWGVRDLEAVLDQAEAERLTLAKRVEMPANNQSLVFRKERS